MNILRANLRFKEIKEPDAAIRKLWERYCPPYAVASVSPLIDGMHTFSRSSALLLSKLHPLILTENQNRCLCNQRILEILTTRLNPDDIVPVWIVPSSTKNHLIEELVMMDILLSTMSYSSTFPAKNIFNLCQELPPSLVREAAPVLTNNNSTIAKALGTASGTIYKWQTDLKSTSHP